MVKVNTAQGTLEGTELVKDMLRLLDGKEVKIALVALEITVGHFFESIDQPHLKHKTKLLFEDAYECTSKVN